MNTYESTHNKFLKIYAAIQNFGFPHIWFVKDHVTLKTA